MGEAAAHPLLSRAALRLGPPRLTRVEWPEPSDADERGGLHWKTRTLVAHAAGRAVAWVDDEITEADRAWTAAHHPGQTLLHRVAARAVTAGRCHAVAVQ